MATCPNINLPEWNILVDARGENMAYALWDKYNGNVPSRELRNTPSEVIAKVKKVIDKMGVNVKDLTEYAKNNPAIQESSINALADLGAGIIAISEANVDQNTLTEEMVHIATAIIEQKDPKLVTEMISKIGRFQIYKDTAHFKEKSGHTAYKSLEEIGKDFELIKGQRRIIVNEP